MPMLWHTLIISCSKIQQGGGRSPSLHFNTSFWICVRAVLSRVLAFAAEKSIFHVTSLMVDGRGSIIFLVDLDVRRHVLCLKEYRTASTERSWLSAIFRLDRDSTMCPAAFKECWENGKEYAEGAGESDSGRHHRLLDDIINGGAPMYR
jgi:hypothetical protein